MHICCQSWKHAYIILTPLNPFYTMKLGFTGVYIIYVLSRNMKSFIFGGKIFNIFE